LRTSTWKFRAIAILGVLVVTWDFACLFSGWVVAPQREASAATMLFCFSALLPLVGLVASWLHHRWGAWILLVSPWIAALGLLRLHGTQKWDAGWFLLLFVLPTSILGLMFQRLLKTSAKEA
jgi:hypothetical protein